MDKDWNQDYIERGIFAQRLYPNEALLQFMGGNGLFSGKQSVKVLEVGCGSGANLWMIAKEGHDAYGIDISEEALNIADRHLQEKWNVKATLKLGSFTDIPFEDNYFDYVVDVVSMQHLDLSTSSAAFSEVYRVLKPEGKFFSMRHGDNSTSFFHGLTSDSLVDSVTVENISDSELPLNNNGTLSFWSPGIANIKYREAGFQLESIERTNRTYKNGKYNVEYLVIVAKKP